MGNIGAATNTARYIQFIKDDGNIGGVVAVGFAGLTYTNGDVIGVAYDAANALVWFNKNNGAWQGNSGVGSPSAGTNGISVAPGNWPMMLFASYANLAGSFALRDYAAAQSAAAPSGFTAWSSYVAPVVSTQGARAMVLA